MVLAGQDAWRKHPLIHECWKKPFPGLGTAAVIFGLYLAYDNFWSSKHGTPPLSLFAACAWVTNVFSDHHGPPPKVKTIRYRIVERSAFGSGSDVEFFEREKVLRPKNLNEMSPEEAIAFLSKKG